jgi:hypothetical protein
MPSRKEESRDIKCFSEASATMAGYFVSGFGIQGAKRPGMAQ